MAFWNDAAALATSPQALQAAAGALLLAAAWWVASRLHAGTAREGAWSSARALVQVAAMGFVLAWLLGLPWPASVPVLLAMAGGAALIAGRRTTRRHGIRTAFLAITAGAALVVVPMALAGAIEVATRTLVPVGSLVVANAMRTTSLALERFEAETGRAWVERAAAAADEQAGRQAAAVALRAALLPSLDMMKSLGWIWIPGIMTGLVLAGGDPVEAAFLQFAVIAMVVAGNVLTAVVALNRARRDTSGGRGDRRQGQTPAPA